ncbi:DUF1672 family protein [Sporolactobacillus sp. CQH2019]|uniref:DUF1672 family protein n=1 Tax=Sporolactobacillus sp. CQH2019 TaxID=3023512 RepID=UPI002367EA02|nr:DUF1672 family protein [Sporolactobacillus sp. CQH2019]MDD9150575.1 DUF1672 family protein [Sporolactobacillus sp. CQH2019]
MPNGEKTGAFAKTHKKEIVDQVNKFFKEKYHLEVTTHNLVGATNAVVAYVESKGEPHFHTSVIVGVDLASQKVTEEVGAYGGLVEGAITSGLYEMAYEKEFKNLDRFAESVVKKYPVIGNNQKAIDNTWDSGYVTPFYYISTLDSDFPKAYSAFMNDHKISKQKLRQLIQQQPFDREGVQIALTFYMGKKYASPDQRIADETIRQFKTLKGIVPGNYGVFIQSNEILKRTGTAKSHKGTITGKTDIIHEPEK